MEDVFQGDFGIFDDFLSGHFCFFFGTRAKVFLLKSAFFCLCTFGRFTMGKGDFKWAFFSLGPLSCWSVNTAPPRVRARARLAAMRNA